MLRPFTRGLLCTAANTNILYSFRYCNELFHNDNNRNNIIQTKQSIRSFSFSYPAPRKLDEIVKLDKFTNLTTPQITALWTDYHRNTDKNQYNVSSVISAEQHNVMSQNIKQSPISIIPVITKCTGSVEYWPCLIQWQDNIALLTAVSNYQQASTKLIPSCTITLYNDLLNDKDITLIRGDIVIPTDMTKSQFSILLQQLIELYTNSELYDRYVYTANHKPNEFVFDDVLQYALKHQQPATS